MSFINDIAQWWAGGDLLMPIMLGVAVALYACIGERAWALFGPAARRGRRGDELAGLVEGAGAGYRAWVAQYVALAEEAELTRGFMVMRVLTACLPLLGLLGTVTGMVATFSGLAGAQSPVGSAQQASAGIGLALTATQYGMALAIPAVLAEWALRCRVGVLVAHRTALSCGLVAAAPEVGA